MKLVFLLIFLVLCIIEGILIILLCVNKNKENKQKSNTKYVDPVPTQTWISFNSEADLISYLEKHCEKQSEEN